MKTSIIRKQLLILSALALAAIALLPIAGAQAIEGGGNLMSQGDVLGFLRTNLGDNQWANPRREEIKTELVEIIKQRGLDFRATVPSDFNTQLSKVGTSSGIWFALQDNYGSPTRQSWLMGTWNLGKIGGAVEYVKNNRISRQGESGVANVGALVMNANGTYVWTSASAQSTKGKWRKASHPEMKSEGGDGIVLLGAKSGYDWIVTKNRRTTNPGDWVSIAELGTRQIKEFGSRAL